MVSTLTSGSCRILVCRRINRKSQTENVVERGLNPANIDRVSASELPSARRPRAERLKLECFRLNEKVMSHGEPLDITDFDTVCGSSSMFAYQPNELILAHAPDVGRRRSGAEEGGTAPPERAARNPAPCTRSRQCAIGT